MAIHPVVFEIFQSKPKWTLKRHLPTPLKLIYIMYLWFYRELHAVTISQRSTARRSDFLEFCCHSEVARATSGDTAQKYLVRRISNCFSRNSLQHIIPPWKTTNCHFSVNLWFQGEQACNSAFPKMSFLFWIVGLTKQAFRRPVPWVSHFIGLTIDLLMETITDRSVNKEMYLSRFLSIIVSRNKHDKLYNGYLQAEMKFKVKFLLYEQVQKINPACCSVSRQPETKMGSSSIKISETRAMFRITIKNNLFTFQVNIIS